MTDEAPEKVPLLGPASQQEGELQTSHAAGLLGSTTDEPDPSPFRLFREVSSQWPRVGIATMFLLVGTLTFVAIPQISGKLIDACMHAAQASPEARELAKQEANKAGVLALIVLVVSGVASGTSSWLFNTSAEQVMFMLRNKLFRAIMFQEIAFFDTTRTGELVNRLSEDIRAMKDTATTSLSQALRNGAGLCLGVTMLFITSWRLSLVTLVLLVVCIVCIRFYAPMRKFQSTSGFTASAAATSVAEEYLSAMRTVRSFAKEEEVCGVYTKSTEQVLRWGRRAAATDGFFAFFMSSFVGSGLIMSLWYGARLVIEGEMTVGLLSSFMLYVIYVASSAGGLSFVLSSVIQAQAAGKRVFQLMDRAPRMTEGQDCPLGDPQGASLQLQDVWFSYPSRSSVMVLKGFNLSVLSGQKVALVGPSGGGKSTIVSLVQRFYDPSQGSVMLDGVDLRLISHMHLHKQVALVAQEPVLFADSILHNLTFSVHGLIDQRMVEAAARAANAHDFIIALPEGYATIVGERGVKLSGGQRQRVAIARALLTQPRLLLLDEATSALDAESEYLVQQALDHASRGRTVLVVAHRLSTVRNADSLAVVMGGVVVEQGTHHELLGQGALYANLVRRQLMGGDMEDADQDGVLVEAPKQGLDDQAVDDAGGVTSDAVVPAHQDASQSA